VADSGDLVAKGADVIVAMGTPGVHAVQQHTCTIPVVFTNVADPVEQGLIDNLARPRGHLTGFTNFEFAIGGKWIELLQDCSLGSLVSRSSAILPTPLMGG
jgi:putative ABC transport system substrate-binding protein